MYDITHGNVTQEEAERLGAAAGSVDGIPHEAGSTEPWVSRLVADLIVARGARYLLETGGFMGATSVWMVDALKRLGGGNLTVVEADPARGSAIATRLRAYEPNTHRWFVQGGDVLTYLTITGRTFDLAFVDDDHTKKHVTAELTLLYPKMSPGGMIIMHDVYGVCDLKTVVAQFGGYSIDLPRLGPAGGLGLIQCP